MSQTEYITIKNISILERLMKMFYTKRLEEFEIGWGQLFFLEYINDHPDTTPQSIAEEIYVDKATVSKAIHVLEKAGYIISRPGETDKRSKMLHVSDQAAPLVDQIKTMHEDFYQILTKDLNESEIVQAEKSLQILADNLSDSISFSRTAGKKENR